LQLWRSADSASHFRCSGWWQAEHRAHGCYLVDVTAAETERRQSETHSDWIRQLFAQLPMQLAYFSPPPDVRCLFANSLYAQALGHDEHSILGRSIGELLTPDELDHLRLASRPFVESGQDLSFLHPRQRLDGEEMLEVSIAADRTPDGRLRGSF